MTASYPASFGTNNNMYYFEGLLNNYVIVEISRKSLKLQHLQEVQASKLFAYLVPPKLLYTMIAR